MNRISNFLIYLQGFPSLSKYLLKIFYMPDHFRC